MRITFLLPLLLLTFALGASGVSAQSVNAVVSKIDSAYAEVSAKAKAAETDDEQGEFGELFVNRLAINSRNHQWRAVGIYQPVYTFFYKEKGESLYPEMLVMVSASRKVSNRTYSEDYLFNEKGALVFYVQKAENDEEVPTDRKIYFSAGKAIRIIDDGKSRDRMTAKDLKLTAETVRMSAKIKDLFVRSMNL